MKLDAVPILLLFLIEWMNQKWWESHSSCLCKLFFSLTKLLDWTLTSAALYKGLSLKHVPFIYREKKIMTDWWNKWILSAGLDIHEKGSYKILIDCNNLFWAFWNVGWLIYVKHNFFSTYATQKCGSSDIRHSQRYYIRF